MQVLRNAILIALAFDATPAEVEAAHDLIDRVAGSAGVDPAFLVHAQVNNTTGNIDTTGTGNTIAPAAQGTPPQVDSAGFPWDERIHSSSKDNRVNADGTWRAKRGVTPALKAQVERELSATMAASGGTAATAPAQSAAQVPTQPALPNLPGSNLPPLPGAAQTDPAYAAFVKLVGENTNSAANPAGRLNDDWVKQVLTHFGVADGSLQNLAHAPQLVPQVDAYVRQALGL